MVPEGCHKMELRKRPVAIRQEPISKKDDRKPSSDGSSAEKGVKKEAGDLPQKKAEGHCRMKIRKRPVVVRPEPISKKGNRKSSSDGSNAEESVKAETKAPPQKKAEAKKEPGICDNLDGGMLLTPNYADLKLALSSIPREFEGPTDDAHKRFVGMFRLWFVELLCGFNILLYGYGSKLRLLKEFSEEYLGHIPLLVVYGFSTSTTLQKFLEILISTVSTFKNTSRSYLAKLSSLMDHYNSNKAQHLCIVVHNIDGKPLRNEKFQWVLNLLSTCKKIFMVASVDHINANIMWNSKTEHRFNWRRYETPTLESYITEISFANPSAAHTTAANLQSAITVLRNLTPTACHIFRILAEHQLSRAAAADSAAVQKKKTKFSKKGKVVGVPYSELLEECLEMLLVSKEASMRQHLCEFRDHKLINFTRSPGTSEQILTIPLSESDLSKLLKLEI